MSYTRVKWVATAAVLACLALAASAEPPAPAQPDAFPVTRTSGDLKLTFTGLELIPPPPGADPDDPNEVSWTRISFRPDWGGRAMREWMTQSVTVTDVSGRTYSPKRLSTYFGKDAGALTFPGPIWRLDQPWKVRIELARTSPVQSYDFWNVYNPDEILSVRALQVPAAGQVVKLGQTAEAQGARVQLLGIAAGNTVLPDAIPVKYPSPTLHWRVERPQDVHVTFLRATDAAGNVIKLRGGASGTGQGGERYARELQVPDGVREVYVAFGVHKSRYFELTGVPSQ
jgi:hypothetical protein